MLKNETYFHKSFLIWGSQLFQVMFKVLILHKTDVYSISAFFISWYMWHCSTSENKDPAS